MSCVGLLSSGTRPDTEDNKKACCYIPMYVLVFSTLPVKIKQMHVAISLIYVVLFLTLTYGLFLKVTLFKNYHAGAMLSLLKRDTSHLYISHIGSQCCWKNAAVLAKWENFKSFGRCRHKSVAKHHFLIADNTPLFHFFFLHQGPLLSVHTHNSFQDVQKGCERKTGQSCMPSKAPNI